MGTQSGRSNEVAEWIELFQRIICGYLSFCGPRTDSLALLVPGVDECAQAACKRVTGHSNDLANGGSSESVEPLAIRVVCDIEA